MRGLFRLARRVGARGTVNDLDCERQILVPAGSQHQIGLTPADQFEIDLGQQLRVEKCAMQGARSIVDVETFAQRIEAGGGARKFTARHRYGIDSARHGQFGETAFAEFEIDETHVEFRVVRDDRRFVAQKFDQVFDHIGEQRLATQEILAQTMHREGFGGHVAFRIDVFVECVAGRQMVDQFDAADLDHAVALLRIKAGRFGIQDDFAHMII